MNQSVGGPMDNDWQAENDADTIMRAEQIERDKARAAKAKQVLQGRKAAIEEVLGEKPEDHLARGYRKPGKK